MYPYMNLEIIQSSSYANAALMKSQVMFITAAAALVRFPSDKQFQRLPFY